MKIVTWNILANEFIEPGSLPRFNSKERFNQIRKVLQQIDADIIFLQEVIVPEFRHLIPPSYVIFQGKNIKWYNRESQSSNIILIRKGMFNFNRRDVQTYHFPFGIGIRLKSMWLLNVHLDDLSYTKRIQQAKQLLPLIQSEKQIILGGDFNQNYKSTSHLYKLLTDAGLKIYMKNPTYFLDGKMSIDHLMTKNLPTGVVLPVDSYEGNFLKQFQIYGSDHLPVVLAL